MKRVNIVCGVLCLLIASCGPRGIRNVVIKGSDTEVNLVLKLAETYMMNDTAISISVTGGGSGSGIAALINGKTDLANSSRPMKASELELAKERGIIPKPVIFAVDALALVVHPAVEIDSLTLEQAGKIYSGEINNWKELGGSDKEISLYGRQSNSGTFVFFRENIVKAEYSSDIKQMNGTAQILESVKVDPAGIGYVGIGYVVDPAGKIMDGIKILRIKKNSNDPSTYPANMSTIINGEYPITRPLYQYVSGDIDGKLKDFIQYELSPKGQEIVQENGYFPITSQHISHNKSLGLYDEISIND